MVCGNFILPEPASYVFFFALFNLRNLSYLIQRSGVPRVTLHGLRHSFATRWLSLDNDICGLSEILGHADVATTLRRYVHSDPDHKADMMQRMEVL